MIIKTLLLSFSLCLFSLTMNTAHSADIAETDQPNQENIEKPSPSYIDIEQVTSPNGLTAWLVHDETLPIISIDFAFKNAGSIHETPKKQGLVRLTSNMLDEGAGDILSQDFQKELHDRSISLSYQNSRDHFYGNLKTLSRNQERAFELLKLSLTQPRFDDEPLARMKKANQSRIRSSLSDPSWLAARLLNDKAFEGHAYAQNSGGTITTLETLTAEDLRDFVKKNLTQDRLVIAVVGDISAATLSPLLDTVFGELTETSEQPSSQDFKLQNMGQSFLYPKEIPQTIIQIQQPGIKKQSDDYFAAQIMNHILGASGFGSRLMEEIREKRGLTYGIYTSMTDMEYIQTLGLSTATSNDNAAELLSVIKEQWQLMRSYPITQEELDNAKAYLIGAFPLALTSTDKISSLLLSLQLDGFARDYLDTREDKIQNVTIEDVFRISQTILAPEKMITILVGNPQNLTNITTVKALPNAE